MFQQVGSLRYKRWIYVWMTSMVPSWQTLGWILMHAVAKSDGWIIGSQLHHKFNWPNTSSLFLAQNLRSLHYRNIHFVPHYLGIWYGIWYACYAQWMIWIPTNLTSNIKDYRKEVMMSITSSINIPYHRTYCRKPGTIDEGLHFPNWPHCIRPFNILLLPDWAPYEIRRLPGWMQTSSHWGETLTPSAGTIILLYLMKTIDLLFLE